MKIGGMMVRALLALSVAMVALPASAEELVFFRSPSGNINCLIATGDAGFVRCDMKELTPSFTSPPPDCELDWGKSFSVGPQDSIGQLACVGDTVIDPTSVPIGYGFSQSAGGFTCASKKSGMTCTNAAGHGFSISKARQTLF